MMKRKKNPYLFATLFGIIRIQFLFSTSNDDTPFSVDFVFDCSYVYGFGSRIRLFSENISITWWCDAMRYDSVRGNVALRRTPSLTHSLTSPQII